MFFLSPPIRIGYFYGRKKSVIFPVKYASPIVTFTLEMRASISVNSIHSFDQNTDADIAISHAKETEGKIKDGKHYSHV